MPRPRWTAWMIVLAAGCGHSPAPVPSAPSTARAERAAARQEGESLVWVGLPFLLARHHPSGQALSLANEHAQIADLVQFYRSADARRIRISSTLRPEITCPVGFSPELMEEVYRGTGGEGPVLASATTLRGWHDFATQVVEALVEAGLDADQVELVLDTRPELGEPEAPMLRARLTFEILVPRSARPQPAAPGEP